jgi:type II secretory pathway pseudopilin PulG
MNKRQKNLLIDFIVVVIVTTIAVVAMVNFKDYVNRSEAVRAMTQLGRIVLDYRKEHGAVPPESYVSTIKENLQGRARLGDLRYRAQWIDFEATPDEILAYTEKNYRSLFFRKGYIVLRLDGRVEWTDKQSFEQMLAAQQSPLEIQMTQK